MLAKLWKKVLFVILIIACLFNITLKFVVRNSLKKELQATLEYFNLNKNRIVVSKSIEEDD